jgi:tetratricopeptide (TPR) repeat protein
MHFEELKKQLSTKLRTLDDLSRFIHTRADGTPNYTLLLGAGCSVTSGVRPATALTTAWRNEIISDAAISTHSAVEDQRQWLKNNHGDWYDPQREYSTLFEKKYDLQRQRRMFVENEVKDATPSIGYAYLTTLVEQDYFNTLFTVNFDDLINEAFFLYSNKRPIVCAHDSSINSVTITSKRPKIIKLHGDYLFDDIKTTDRETESLGQNMKEKFIEFAKDFGLIVVGYAGGDRSIIDVLSMLLKNEDYFRNGIYWCLRKGSEIPEELRRLFWKDRVYFVEIEGFDEFFAELYSKFNKGDTLPSTVAQPISRFEASNISLLENNSRFPETTEVLRKAKERMKKLSKRKTLANQIVNPEGKERAISNSEFTDDELLVLTKLQRMMIDGNYDDVLDNAKIELRKISNQKIKNRITAVVVEAYLGLRQDESAIKTLDSLIMDDPKNIQWYLNKVKILNDPTHEFDVLNKALGINEQSVECKIAFADWHLRQKEYVVGEKRIEHIDKAEELLKEAIILNPSATSIAWSKLYSLILKHTTPKNKRNELLNDLENDLAKQGKFRWGLIQNRIERIDIDSDTSSKKSLISDIKEAQNRADFEDSILYECLLMEVHCKTGMIAEAKEILATILKSEKSKTELFIIRAILDTLRINIGDDEQALKIINEHIKLDDFDITIFRINFQILLDLQKFEIARKILEENKWRLKSRTESNFHAKIFEAERNFPKAIEYYKLSQLAADNLSNNLQISYLLLCNNQDEAAKSLLQTDIQANNSSGELAAQIVNYELARKRTGSKVDNNRLEKVLLVDKSLRTKAAVSALKDHKKDAIEAIREAIKNDRTFKYEAKCWPVFKELHQDDSFIQLIK